MASAATLMARPVSGFWRYYCLQLDRRPLLTRCVTGLVGGALGDAAAQLTERASARRRHSLAAGRAHKLTAGGRDLHDGSGAAVAGHVVGAGALYGAADATGVLQLGEEHDAAYDWVRTLRLALWGALVGAPMGYKWYQMLDGRVSPGNPTSAQAVITKVLLDQLIMAPFGTALFFVGIKTLEGNAHLALPTLFEQYPTAMAANYTLWPLAHVINFKFVPASQRILYVNAVAVVWTAVLSHLVEGHQQDATSGGHQQHAKSA